MALFMALRNKKMGEDVHDIFLNFQPPDAPPVWWNGSGRSGASGALEALRPFLHKSGKSRGQGTK
jgi:hypothetical protein